ncbi:uncharacterized protein [Diabrotica undecimpunctata]|uniref:uncharacterized protein n=1 Tax=Diabrotica undecimpunctata TaxID=50387 RepID=UPI003B63B9C0
MMKESDCHPSTTENCQIMFENKVSPSVSFRRELNSEDEGNNSNNLSFEEPQRASSIEEPQGASSVEEPRRASSVEEPQSILNVNRKKFRKYRDAVLILFTIIIALAIVTCWYHKKPSALNETVVNTTEAVPQNTHPVITTTEADLQNTHPVITTAEGVPQNTHVSEFNNFNSK